MEHLTDRQLQQAVAGEAVHADDAVHAGQCPSCGKRLDDMHAVWGAMGHWRVAESADLSAKIVQAARTRRLAPLRVHAGLRAWVVRASRIAAIVLLAATAFVAGRYSGFHSGQGGAGAPVAHAVAGQCSCCLGEPCTCNLPPEKTR
jgi:hypothetical protein